MNGSQGSKQLKKHHFTWDCRIRGDWIVPKFETTKDKA